MCSIIERDLFINLLSRSKKVEARHLTVAEKREFVAMLLFSKINATTI